MKDSNETRILLLFLFLLVLGNVYVWQFIFGLNGNLKVVFFDVGDGDAILMETPQKHQILIDGGPGDKILEKLGKDLPFWDRTIDLVILTHPEYDHLSGLVLVLERYKVKNILWNGVKKETLIFKQWEEGIKKEKALVVIAKKGQKIKAGVLEARILHPLEGKVKELAQKNYINDTSIVSRFSFGKASFLFPGDITKRTELALILDYTCFEHYPCPLEVDVLKVSHHGSRTSTSEEFLAQVKPKLAVISCAINSRYGFPHQQTLNSLQKSDIKVLRTDEIGDIAIATDGTNITNSK